MALDDKFIRVISSNKPECDRMGSHIWMLNLKISDLIRPQKNWPICLISQVGIVVDTDYVLGKSHCYIYSQKISKRLELLFFHAHGIGPIPDTGIGPSHLFHLEINHKTCNNLQYHL